MLHWIGFAFIAGGFSLAARWMIAKTMGPVPPFPWRAVMALALVGSVAAAPWYLRVRLEQRLSAAASEVSDRDVFVQCQSFAAAFIDPTADLGHVAFDAKGRAEPKTLIKRDQCRALTEYLRSDKRNPTMDQVVAVHVLTHESIHMSGTVVEDETECLAMARNSKMAQLLGAPPDAAQELALTYWEKVYPDMPDEYRSSECDPGLVAGSDAGSTSLGTSP